MNKIRLVKSIKILRNAGTDCRKQMRNQLSTIKKESKNSTNSTISTNQKDKRGNGRKKISGVAVRGQK